MSKTQPLHGSHRPEFWRSLAIMAVTGNALNAVVAMALVPALPLLTQFLALNNNNMFGGQMFIFASGLATAIAAPMAGPLITKQGPIRAMLICLVTYLFAGLGSLLLSNAYYLLMARLIIGAAGGFVVVISLFIAAQFDARMRAGLFAWATALGSVSAICSLVGAGMLVDIGGWRYHSLSYLVSVPIILVTMWVWLHAPKAPYSQAPVAVLPGNSPPSAFMLYFLMFLFSGAFFCAATSGPFLLRCNGLVSAADQGSMLTILPITAAVISMRYAAISRVVPTGMLLILTAISLASGLLLCVVLSSPIAGLCLIGLGTGVATPTIVRGLLVVNHPRNVPRALGFNVSAIFLGQSASSLVGALSANGCQPGVQRAFLFFAVLCIMAACTLVLTTRFRKLISDEAISQ